MSLTALTNSARFSGFTSKESDVMNMSKGEQQKSGRPGTHRSGRKTGVTVHGRARKPRH
jgi:hypothetical protein